MPASTAPKPPAQAPPPPPPSRRPPCRGVSAAPAPRHGPETARQAASPQLLMRQSFRRWLRPKEQHLLCLRLRLWKNPSSLRRPPSCLLPSRHHHLRPPRPPSHPSSRLPHPPLPQQLRRKRKRKEQLLLLLPLPCDPSPLHQRPVGPRRQLRPEDPKPSATATAMERDETGGPYNSRPRRGNEAITLGLPPPRQDFARAGQCQCQENRASPPDPPLPLPHSPPHRDDARAGQCQEHRIVSRMMVLRGGSGGRPPGNQGHGGCGCGCGDGLSGGIAIEAEPSGRQPGEQGGGGDDKVKDPHTHQADRAKPSHIFTPLAVRAGLELHIHTCPHTWRGARRRRPRRVRRGGASRCRSTGRRRQHPPQQPQPE